jgi:chaperonin GroES
MVIAMVGSEKETKEFDLEKEIKAVPFDPLFSRIMVKERVIGRVGSIVIPSASKEMRATEGIVLAVGGDVEVIKVGDNIFYGQYCGVKINRDGKEYQVMNDNDVIAIIKGDANAGA